MNFTELRVPKPLLNALEDLEFVYPTPIQQKCYRVISSGIDVVGIARTGTGKTFAYLLPIIGQLEYSTQRQPRVLIIVPTRELVIQVKEEAEKLCKYKNVRIKAVYGGANINTQKEYLYDGGCDIIVGTPGRLFDIAVTGVLRFAGIKKVVIDEVDEMLSLGFRPQLDQIFEMLPEKRQNSMFSATLSEDVQMFIQKHFEEASIVEVDDRATPAENIIQKVVQIPNFNTKLNFLVEILKNTEEYKKNLIFVSSKKQADLIFENLSSVFEDEIGIIHSNKSQNFRFNAIKAFEKGKIRTLIATDVVSRGLDFADISHVINFSVPEIPTDYIHRIGRTGRAEKSGNSLLFVAPYEEDYFNLIKTEISISVETENLPENIKISEILHEDEKISYKQKNIVSAPDISKSGGAFHEKSLKNRKTNSGGLRQKAKRKQVKRSAKTKRK